MSTALQFSTTLMTEICYSCGVQFAMPQDMRERRLEDHKNFYCPSGHGQHYTGQTEAEKQRERAEHLAGRLTHTQDQLEATERRRRAEKGAKTRILNRVHNGVCPHCNRTFVDLAAHMVSKHGEETADVG